MNVCVCVCVCLEEGVEGWGGGGSFKEASKTLR